MEGAHGGARDPDFDSGSGLLEEVWLTLRLEDEPGRVSEGGLWVTQLTVVTRYLLSALSKGNISEPGTGSGSGGHEEGSGEEEDGTIEAGVWIWPLSLGQWEAAGGFLKTKKLVYKKKSLWLLYVEWWEGQGLGVDGEVDVFSSSCKVGFAD